MGTWSNKAHQLTQRARRMLSHKHAYSVVFRGSEAGGQVTRAGADVMRDIAQFCGAYNSTAKISPINRTVDPLAMAMAEGRRQVYLHIQRRLRLTDDQILNMMEEAHD